VLMIDSRHGFTPLDLQLLDFVSQRVKTGEIKLLVLLTKCDKLSQREAQLATESAQQVLGEFVTESSDIAVVLFSSMRRVGVEDVAEQMRAWMRPRERAQQDDGATAEGASAPVAGAPPAPDAPTLADAAPDA